MSELTLNASGWEWLRSPVHADAPEADSLVWTCGPDCDLWRLTAGGPIKHDAPAYVTEVRGDFTIEGTFAADFKGPYDQVGFVAIGDPENWLKAGFELDEGEIQVGAVYTGSHSDWSRAPGALPGALRIQRSSGTIEVHVGDGPDRWRMIRQLYLDADLRIGPYSAAPLSPGFAGRLSAFALQVAPSSASG